MKLPLATLAHLAVVAAAGAQMSGHWVVQVEYEPGSGGSVSPAHPTATVRILAGFTGAFAFAGGDGDLLASDGQWVNLRLLDVGDPPGPPPPGTTPGSVVGSDVKGFVFGQIFFPLGWPPSTANPIPLWEGVWTTPSFSPRDVRLETANSDRFSLYDISAKSHPVNPTHGSAQIRVVPAPGAALLGATALLLSTARRRRHAGVAGPSRTPFSEITTCTSPLFR
jgi:hypothetical protein